MNVQVVTAAVLASLGALCAAIAVWNERRMQRHRQPGVTYSAATLRKDGGWRRADLFTPEGLAHQKQASRYGLTALLFWLLALAAWVLLGAT